MKPIILLLPNMEKSKFTLSKYYVEAIEKAGGIPLIISYASLENLDNFLEIANGFLFTGGGDIDSSYFSQPLHEKADCVFKDRDEFEIALFKKAYDKNIPILAICRGMQIMNVALGGELNQHIEDHAKDGDRTEPVHKIEIKKDNIIYELVKKDELSVNSIHHQAISKLGKNLTVAATCGNVIECIQCSQKDFVLGTQWHPEAMVCKYHDQFKIFLKFVEMCKGSEENV